MNKIEQFVKLLRERMKHNTILFRSGYAVDQKGIQKRYYREKTNWEEHLENSKKYILSCAEKLSQTRRVAILGSGWFYDVPYIQLSTIFEEVDCYDIIHPRYVKEKIKNYKNIRLIETDLTGSLIAYADNCKNIEEFTIGIEKIRPVIDLEKYDLVVSLNLLNQLDILLCDFLIKKFRTKSEDLTAIRKKVQSDHLNILPMTKTCLITDYKELSINRNNEIIDEKELVFIPFPEHHDGMEWQWIFDTHYSYSDKFNTTFRVKAIQF